MAEGSKLVFCPSTSFVGHTWRLAHCVKIFLRPEMRRQNWSPELCHSLFELGHFSSVW